jgi:hypothetical protein
MSSKDKAGEYPAPVKKADTTGRDLESHTQKESVNNTSKPQGKGRSTEK